MNARDLWYVAGCAAAAGLGSLITAVVYEKKLREQTTVNIFSKPAINQEPVGKALNIREDEAGVTYDFVPNIGAILDGQPVEKEAPKDYVQAVVETSYDETTDAIEFIDDTEFFDEDIERWREQIHIILTDTDPIFMMDGAPINDWAERIGENIMAEMYIRQPPGTDGVLYVRNNLRDEDYEVMRELP